jgi:hypothetical protein
MVVRLGEIVNQWVEINVKGNVKGLNTGDTESHRGKH